MPQDNQLEFCLAVGLKAFSANDRIFWKAKRDGLVEFEIALTGVGPDQRTINDVAIVRDDETRFDFSISWSRLNGFDEPVLLCNPRFNVKNEWQPYRHGQTYLNNNGTWGAQHSQLELLKPSLTILVDWASQMKFFDPVRALSKGSATGMNDGSLLIKELYDRGKDEEEAAQFHTLKTNILDLVNSLLVPSGVSRITEFLIKGDPTTKLVLMLTSNDVPLSIESMGTGISEIFMTCCWLAMEDKQPRQYFLEEPETHLHPGLLRRYMQLFDEHKHIQLLVNSHSSVLLNALDRNSRVWLFQKNNKNGTSAHLCSEFIHHHQALDALGINGAALLQANCTIWVEGPSDRIYINRWLKEFEFGASEYGEIPPLVEGSDYSFVLYGGKLISHYGFSDPMDADDEELNTTELQNTISMLSISRFSAVLMDRDIAPSEEQSKIRKVKLEIVREAEKDPAHRLAVFTDGREIENDVYPSAFLKAVQEVLNLETLPKVSLTGNKRFTKEIAESIGLLGEDAKKFENRLSQHKVELAEASKTPLLERDWAKIPTYIERLYQFILSSRVEPEAEEEADSMQFEE
jgi:hypothetical protein